MNSNILNETFDKHLRLLKSKLNEEENPTLSQNITQPDNIDTETKVKLIDLMNKKFDEGFVNKLKELISDEKVRQFLNAAKIDGNLKDDKITVTGDPNGTAVKVDGLSATQSEVFLDKSIGFPIEKGLSDQIKHFILQGSAPSGFPPIVISGKYVIDGHHRWSQVFCWNYESTIPAVSIEFEGQSNPDELLKKIHLTIAAQRGSVPLEDKGGTLNLFTLNQTQLFEWLNEKLTAFPKIIDEVFKDSAVKRKMMDRIKSQNVDDSNNTKYIETLITPYIFTNIQAIKEKKGNHPRKIMPQTEKETSLPAYFGKLKTGDINVDVNEIFQRHLKLLHNKLNLNENKYKDVSIEELAKVSDEALDKAYGYGRSSPGNTFGWQSNLKSAEYAKKAIMSGITDIEKISDMIHKGWNVTAKAFVKNPEQFSDTEKLKASGKLEAKLAQREKLMNIEYSQLPEEEKEKDRVVARALLDAIQQTIN